MNEKLEGLLKKIRALDENGNFIIGQGNVVEISGGQVKDNVVVGENEVTSQAEPGQPVVISGNKLFGKNKITIK